MDLRKLIILISSASITATILLPAITCFAGGPDNKASGPTTVTTTTMGTTTITTSTPATTTVSTANPAATTVTTNIPSTTTVATTTPATTTIATDNSAPGTGAPPPPPPVIPMMGVPPTPGMIAPAMAWGFRPYFFVGGSVGFAMSNWSQFGLQKFIADSTASGFSRASSWDATDDGLIWGVTGGWQFKPNFGVEAGGYKMFDGEGKFQLLPPNPLQNITTQDTLGTEIAYLAAKMDVPIAPRVNLFAKIGPTYRRIDHDIECTITQDGTSVPCDQIIDTSQINDGHYWTAYMGAGLDVSVFNNLGMELQWFYIPANDTGGDSADGYEDQAPAINAFVATFQLRLHQF